MKTTIKQSKLKTFKSIITVVLIINCITTLGQDNQNHLKSDNDHLFSLKGKKMLTIATGIPYIGVVEYAYGLSDKITVGVMIGKTPNVTGYGARIRVLLYNPNDNYRIYFRSPVLYYPKTKNFGDEPWILTWPVISSEWKLKSGARLSVGGGFVEAHCVAAMFGREMTNCHLCEEVGKDMGFKGGIWNTLHAGIAAPISKRVMFQGEFRL